MLDRLYGAIRGIDLAEESRRESEPPAALIEALEDDLNTPKALAAMFALTKKLNKADDANERLSLAAELVAAGDLMGLLQYDAEDWFSSSAKGELSAGDIDGLLKERDNARSNKDFSRADEIRDQLAAAGITIEDGVEGTRWRRGK